jgi:hypothetical protein
VLVIESRVEEQCTGGDGKSYETPGAVATRLWKRIVEERPTAKLLSVREIDIGKFYSQLVEIVKGNVE